MRIAIFGAGLVGRRTATLLCSEHQVTLYAQHRSAPTIDGVRCVAGWDPQEIASSDVVVLATASQYQFTLARELVRAGRHVICTADNAVVIERLWALGQLARDRGACLIVGAAFSPGVSTALVMHLANGFDQVHAMSSAQFGTGGPACAREHHRAMNTSSREVSRGLLRPARAGSGRELVWFPEPVGPADCYRAGLAEPFLLHQLLPHVPRIEARQAATRRDRLTARLPMLRPPHAEGLLGAVWVEVRGQTGQTVEHRTLAATAPQASGAAAMAAALCETLAEQTSTDEPSSNSVPDSFANARPGTDLVLLEDGGEQGIRSGVQSAGHLATSRLLTKVLSNGVRLWTYDGSRLVENHDITGPVSVARKWKTPGSDPLKTA